MKTITFPYQETALGQIVNESSSTRPVVVEWLGGTEKCDIVDKLFRQAHPYPGLQQEVLRIMGTYLLEPKGANRPVWRDIFGNPEYFVRATETTLSQDGCLPSSPYNTRLLAGRQIIANITSKGCEAVWLLYADISNWLVASGFRMTVCPYGSRGLSTVFAG